MKVFNITDVETRALKQQGLVGVSIKVGEVSIAPGESQELRGTAKEKSEVAAFIRRGAASVDQLPPGYAHKRGLLLSGDKPSTTTPEPTPDPGDDAGGRRRRGKVG